MTLEEIRAQLAGLTRAELRALAWDALLLSDGPNHVEGGEGRHTVRADDRPGHMVRVHDRPVRSFRIFVTPGQ